MPTLTASSTDAPLGAIIVARFLRNDVEFAQKTSLKVADDLVLTNQATIIRFLAELASSELYSGSVETRTRIDHWLNLCSGPLDSELDFLATLKYIEQSIKPEAFLVNNALSAADFALVGALHQSAYFLGLKDEFKTVRQWYEWMKNRSDVKEAIKALPQSAVVKPKALQENKKGNNKESNNKKGNDRSNNKKGNESGVSKKDEGKFVELPGAEKGKVVVRFPPEASGYLHIGHAKAALLNQYYRDAFEGRLILRFDDTNPAKEKEAFEKIILEDLKMLEVRYDHFSRSSDYFDTLIQYCEKLIKEGKAFVDDTDAETMKEERDARKESRNRSNSVSQNLKLWQEMKQGSDVGQKCAVRAKIDMNSNNGAMRDPTIYRCKLESHTATMDKFKVYPTYDFACPLIDSIEGVTHALRTTEYMDRDEQYNWFIDALGLRKPFIYAYSRLSMTNTVMSKRKLTWFVEQNLVEDWDDPRFPTVRGVLRRGMTVEALKQFIVAQGSSRSVVFMEWDKIWAMNKKVIDPIAPRYTLVRTDKQVEVKIHDLSKEWSDVVDAHPKNKDVGTKTVWKGPNIVIDESDAQLLKENENATFINWGNVMIKKVHRDKNQVVTLVEAETNLENTDFKKTPKITWLAQREDNTPVTAIYYDHLITKKVLDKDDDFKDFIHHENKGQLSFQGDPDLAKLRKGDIIQIQRKGFFVVDEVFRPLSPNIGRATPLRLIAIPDGTPQSYAIPEDALPDRESKVVDNSKNNVDKKDGKDNKEKKGKAKVSEAPKASDETVSTEVTVDAELERELGARVASQGELVRKLKTEKADKADVEANVKILLDLKAKYKEKIGKDYAPPSNNARKDKKETKDSNKKENKNEEKKKGDKPKENPKESKSKDSKKGDAKKDKAKPQAAKKEESQGGKQTRLGLEFAKESSLADWYSQIIIKSELLEYYDVSGCYIFRPWAFSIWERIQGFFDGEIKKMGVENCYFPIFVSQAALQKEKDHIADFSPEVAWVTRSGDSDMAEPVAIRPTSETVMYPAYAKWIQSYRDLPLKLNQWNNVVRWEFKHPQPFLRTREFLWQEGHTAFATQEEALEEVYAILELYRRIYEELLAVPVIPGRKTEKEKFAGGDFTTTVEAYIGAAGRAIQAATSHHLGQNFSKMFEIAFEDPESGEKRHVYQNSWGCTTRTLGVLTMVHGDNKGLVLPPRVANLQVVIVPCGITASLKEDDRKTLYDACKQYEQILTEESIRVSSDMRENYSPGWKFNHWELKGVPVRLELGPRDVKNGQFVTVRRDSGQKEVVEKKDLVKHINRLLETIQKELFDKAKADLDEHVKLVETWPDFLKALSGGNLILAPFCGGVECEEAIKERSKGDVEADPGAPSMGAKGLCIPFKQPKEVDPDKPCMLPECPDKPKFFALFGRSY